MPPDPICPGEGLDRKIALLEARLEHLFSQAPNGSELKAVFEELQQAERRRVDQERMQALAQMASGFAHDLNNSLTPIIGFSDYLLDTQSSTLLADIRKCLQGIRAAAADIVQVVEQLRQFYRLRDTQEPLDLIDLNHLAVELLNVSIPRSFADPSRSIQIKTHLDPALPTICDSEGDVRIAIHHLVSNALAAMPKGGTLTVATRLHPGAQGNPALVVLEVQDTGHGMNEATRRACLEPFFSTKGPRRRGLGLAVVYGIMRRHQGGMQIESQPNRGTTVRLFFNLAQCPPAGPGTGYHESTAAALAAAFA